MQLPFLGPVWGGAVHRIPSPCCCMPPGMQDEWEAEQPLLSQGEGSATPLPPAARLITAQLALLWVGCGARKISDSFSLTSLLTNRKAGWSPQMESALFSLYKDITRWPGFLSSQIFAWWAVSNAVSSSQARLLPAAAELRSSPLPSFFSHNVPESI